MPTDGFKGSAEKINNKLINKTMTKEQEQQMNDYYLELKKDGLITTLNESMIFKLSYEKAFSLNGVVASLPTEEAISEKIKTDLLKINKDKPLPSCKHDLGYSNGFLECYDFMTKKG